jgi:hypothetical protein
LLIFSNLGFLLACINIPLAFMNVRNNFIYASETANRVSIVPDTQQRINISLQL